MKLAIEHTAHYQYENNMQLSTQFLRLTPSDTCRQKILHWELSLPSDTSMVRDGFGNILHVMTLDEPRNEISIQVKGEVEIIDEAVQETDEQYAQLVYLRHTYLTRPDISLEAFAHQHLKQPVTLHGIHDLMQQVRLAMPYSCNDSLVHHSANEAFHLGTAISRDHTHVFLACCRAKGLPARYVSGYLYNPDSKDVTSHAWAEVWLNNIWNTCDISNGLTQPSLHLKLAVGLDYLDACPVRGIRSGGGNEAMSAIASVAHLIKKDMQSGCH